MNLPSRNDLPECRSSQRDPSACGRCHPQVRQRNLSAGRCYWPHHGQILEVRSHFLSTGAVPDGVPTPLVRSWQRSSQFGFAPPTLGRQRDRLAEAGLRTLKDCNGELIASAWEEMVMLGEELSEFGGVIVLTDPSGIVLRKLGGGSFSDEADRLGLSEGFDWSEQAIGTNAIGTAALEKLALSVIGAEHLFCLNTAISCSAVPILDPTGGLAGVLDVSTPFSVAHNHLLALVKRAAFEIERRLFERRFTRQAKLRFHSSQHMLGSPREGWFAFDGDRLVGANRAALELVARDWSVVGNARFGQVFTYDFHIVERLAALGDCKLRSAEGAEFFARLELPQKPSTRTPASIIGLKSGASGRSNTRDVPPHLALEKIEGRGTIHFRRMNVGQLIHGADLLDECGEAVLIFASGRYRCFASHEGRELTLFTLGCGDAFPLRADLVVEVCGEGDVAIIHRALFKRLVADHPEFGGSVLSVIETLLNRSISMVGDMAFRSVRHRVIRHICALAERDGRETPSGVVIDTAPIGDELATAIGAARQSVSTVLAELIRAGDIVRPTARSLVIPNINGLRAELQRSQ